MPSLEELYGKADPGNQGMGAISEAERAFLERQMLNQGGSADRDTAFNGRADTLSARLRAMNAPEYRAGGSIVDQIPGAEPGYGRQPTIAPEGGAGDWIRRNFLSGGGGDIRNVLQAMGPAVQAAGGMDKLIALAQRLGLPAKASGAPLDAADDLFQSAVSSAPGQALRGVGAAQGGAIGPKMAAALAGAAGGVGYGVYSIIDAVNEMNKRRQKAMEDAQKQMR